MFVLSPSSVKIIIIIIDVLKTIADLKYRIYSWKKIYLYKRICCFFTNLQILIIKISSF